jgi:hypothetical protein
MRRCPYCFKKTPPPEVACERCGVRVTDLDAWPAWRALRYHTRGPRRALPTVGLAALLLAAGLGPIALVVAAGPERLLAVTLRAEAAVAGLDWLRLAALEAASADPALAALRFCLLLVGAALVVLAGGRLTGEMLVALLRRGPEGGRSGGRPRLLLGLLLGGGTGLLLLAQDLL